MIQILLGLGWDFGIYILISSAFCLYLKYLKILDFSFCASIGFGAFLFWQLQSINIWLALSVSSIFTISFGIISYSTIFSKLKKSFEGLDLLFGLILTDLIQNIFLILFGSNIKVLEFYSYKVEFFGLTLNTFGLVFLIIAGIIYFLLFYILDHTIIGLKIKSSKFESQFSNLDQNPLKYKLLIVVLALFCIYLASLGVVFSKNLQFTVLINFTIKGWLIAIISDNNFSKVFYNSFILILIEALVVYFLDKNFRDVILYGFIIFWIIIKDLPRLKLKFL